MRLRQRLKVAKLPQLRVVAHPLQPQIRQFVSERVRLPVQRPKIHVKTRMRQITKRLRQVYSKIEPLNANQPPLFSQNRLHPKQKFPLPHKRLNRMGRLLHPRLNNRVGKKPLTRSPLRPPPKRPPRRRRRRHQRARHKHGYPHQPHRPRLNNPLQRHQKRRDQPQRIVVPLPPRTPERQFVRTILKMNQSKRRNPLHRRPRPKRRQIQPNLQPKPLAF